MINRVFFFEYVTSHLFAGNLKPSQRAGITTILDEWEAHHAAKDDRWLAYMLGTAFHETAYTMQPIDERGGDAYFTKLYDIAGQNPANARAHGNTTKGDGPRYHGRGLVQLTWKANYATMSAIIGVDLVASPDLAKDTAIATKIMFHGMMHGSFTGKKLPDYFNETTEDWFNARKIILKLDCAEKIAGHARNFYAAIGHTTG